MGGKIGIIIDDKIEEDPEKLIMVDDGAGQSIKIPSFITSYAQGKLITQRLAGGEEVFLKVDVSIRNPDNRVEYDLWYSEIFDLEKDLLRDLGAY